RYLIRDRDRYGDVALRRLRAMGIRDKPIAPTSPWQNGFAELGSIRRECVDHIAVWGEGALAPDLAGLCPLLQRPQNAPVTGQRCARLSLCSTDRRHRGIPDPRRTPSPLRPGLSFRYTQAINWQACDALACC